MKENKDCCKFDLFDQLVKVHSALGEESRIKIVYILMQHNFCAVHIQEFLNLRQSSVSRHLEKLMAAGIIVCRKEGRRKIYSLSTYFVNSHACEIDNIKQACSGMFDGINFDQHKDLCENENTHI